MSTTDHPSHRTIGALLNADQVQAWLTVQVERAEASGRDDLARDLAQIKLELRRVMKKGLCHG